VLGYIGGKATHVWAHDEWARFAGLAQFPAWACDMSAEPRIEAAHAAAAATVAGWMPGEPEPLALVGDLETGCNPEWWARFDDQLRHLGYLGVAYGSLGTVAGNMAAAIWSAAWDGHAVLNEGEVVHAHQYAANVRLPGGALVDYSVADDWLMARALRR
jgi:hypothetical protein